jgi:hypothetical protein
MPERTKKPAPADRAGFSTWTKVLPSDPSLTGVGVETSADQKLTWVGK